MKELNSLTPETLEESDREEVYKKLKKVCAMCVTQKNLESDIMSSPAYSALRKGVYSKDEYVRLLSLKALAGLARSSKDVRKRIATTMDFVRLEGEISTSEDVLRTLSGNEKSEETNKRVGEAVKRYMNLTMVDFSKDIPKDEISTMLAYSFDDIVSSVAFHTDSHVKLMQLNYGERCARMLKSSSFNVRATAVRSVAGLTRTIEGRQALAKTDAFPSLYDMIYNDEKREVLFKSPTINFAKFAMQQLLLSESALDIMLPRYEKYFMAMKREAKEDLLMKFDLQDDTDYDKAIVIGKQAAIAFAFGTVWGALRSLVTSEWRAGMAKPQVRMSHWKKILIGSANASTGTIPLVALYLLVTHTSDSSLVRLKDSPATYTLSNAAFAGVLALVSATVLNIFPYSFVPTLVGVNAKHILSAIPGTTENEQMAYRLANKDSLSSDDS